MIFNPDEDVSTHSRLKAAGSAKFMFPFAI